MKQIIDGCTAAAHVAFALSDVATIYPITPIASMGQTAQKWGMEGRKNLMGQALDVQEMESELGAAGATHGALAAGALATTFTASQGLLLMIPNMYKISGELLPSVFHVGCRSLATHALSIFGDHQDVMACLPTGFAFLASASVQETMDLAVVAHLAAIDGRVPVVHMMDGWRTSNEMATCDVIDYETIRPLVNWENVDAFRRRSMNPVHPDLRGSAQNPDVYFQNREAPNRYYDAFPSVVQAAMDRLSKAVGRTYHLFDSVGDPAAELVVVALGSSNETIEETVSVLNKEGYRAGAVKVRLYRPFDASAFVAAIPKTAKVVCALDRTKEPGSQGEPLLKDVVMALFDAGRTDVRVIGGRYGLSSKDFDPAMVRAVYDEMKKPEPKRRFTVGITDDVTHLSLEVGQPFDVTPEGVYQCRFYGIGADGTVGATKQAAQIVSDLFGFNTQASFNYSAKKSGGYTVSNLRYGTSPIRSEYDIIDPDYVGCNKATYVQKFHVLANIKEGGTFVLNSKWTTVDDLEKALPARIKRTIAGKKLKFYNIDAQSIAEANGLGVRINTIMETVFLHLAPGVDLEKAMARLKELIQTTYAHEGNRVVEQNLAAVDAALAALKEIDYPAEWATATDAPKPTGKLPEFIEKISIPCNELQGNTIPVSELTPDGTMPMGTTAYEKRRIAVNIPRWEVEKCIECTQCSLVCPHAAIRPYLLDATEKENAPADFVTRPARAKQLEGLEYRIQVYPEDCVGCGSCATICPGHALTMVPIAEDLEEQIPLLEYAQTKVTIKDNLVPKFTLMGSQFQQPLLQFSGACAGCGETPYVKLLTQLFGDKILVANATGCSSVWGANFPSNAYCTNRFGHGPAWGNSLFEDNAEYGYGMVAAVTQRRDRLVEAAERLVAKKGLPTYIDSALTEWLKVKDDLELSQGAGERLAEAVKALPDDPDARLLADGADMLGRKTVWAIGGDGWAYDIGFAGLDHVLASGKNINLLVMDTECYSNTGGQTSKATPLGAVAKYSPDGKRTIKKDLGRMMMTYGTVYVTSISLGANPMQAITALREAEEFPGPSIVIAYCPCINHGIRAGMSHAMVEERQAVLTGYWNLYRYNPANPEPLTVDSAAPNGQLLPFINGEDRYADLRMVDPKEADVLQPELAAHQAKVYSILTYQTKYGATNK